ncbi:MAG TPA: hypothetical protein VK052_03290 [Zeimonas sp.]|nr:hypothetical protein [Zeimonas sp.]
MSDSRWTEQQAPAEGAPAGRLRRGAPPARRHRGQSITIALLAAIALSAVGALHGAAVAHAADASGVPDADTRYRQERERCERIESPADRAVCLREAAAARAEARRGLLTDRPDDPIRYLENALKRCEPLPPDERADCEYRVRGGGTTRGSVEAGGIYRETVTREVERPREIRLPEQPPAGRQ